MDFGKTAGLTPDADELFVPLRVDQLDRELRRRLKSRRAAANLPEENRLGSRCSLSRLVLGLLGLGVGHLHILSRLGSLGLLLLGGLLATPR